MAGSSQPEPQLVSAAATGRDHTAAPQDESQATCNTEAIQTAYDADSRQDEPPPRTPACPSDRPVSA